MILLIVLCSQLKCFLENRAAGLVTEVVEQFWKLSRICFWPTTGIHLSYCLLWLTEIFGKHSYSKVGGTGQWKWNIVLANNSNSLLWLASGNRISLESARKQRRMYDRWYIIQKSLECFHNFLLVFFGWSQAIIWNSIFPEREQWKVRFLNVFSMNFLWVITGYNFW